MLKSKKIITVIIAVFILLTSLCVSVSAEDDPFDNTHVNTGVQRIDIVEIAKTQIGYMEGPRNDTKYGSWYGLPNQPWCAMFVSWCARQAGVPLDVLRNCAIAAPDPGYFDIPFYDGLEYTPQTGDLFFTKTFSHVGIVYHTDGDYFYSIEGNTNLDGSSEGVGVFLRTRKISDYIFGVPDYNYVSKQSHQCDKSSTIGNAIAHPHYTTTLCSICKSVNPDYSTFNYSDHCPECVEKHIKGYYGDADTDRHITIKDATVIQKHIAKITFLLDNAILFADVNEDSDVTIKDATAIQKYIAGITVDYPVGKEVT